jgi:1,4-alpha-glucan branching enzyme
MQSLDATYRLLEDPLIEQLMVHEDNKLLVYRRGPLVFAFNFHPTQSYPDLRIPVPDPANYRQILDSDEAQFEGFGRVKPGMVYPRENVPWEGRQQSVRLYLPNRSVQVLAPVT